MKEPPKSANARACTHNQTHTHTLSRPLDLSPSPSFHDASPVLPRAVLCCRSETSAMSTGGSRCTLMCSGPPSTRCCLRRCLARATRSPLLPSASSSLSSWATSTQSALLLPQLSVKPTALGLSLCDRVCVCVFADLCCILPVCAHALHCLTTSATPPPPLSSARLAAVQARVCADNSHFRVRCDVTC